MKHFLLFIAFAISQTGIACDCSESKFMEKYVQSDFVALVTITKNFPNQGEDFYYKSDIMIHDLFKGDQVESILVKGSSDGKRRTSCDKFFKKGTKMLIYAQKIGKYQYILDYCSSYRVLSGMPNSDEKRELEMLNFLKLKGIKTTDKSWYGVDLGEKLDALRGEKLTRSFAIFEITFADSLQIASVSTVIGFSSEVDQKLMVILKQGRWFSTPGKRVAQGSKFLFAFYYYPAEGEHQSIISEYDV